uniref:Uncharacterized protein n=1 Tax=Anguilla anguilla TaxID=7936 RepID=A0A0E9RB91_ANGAN
MISSKMHVRRAQVDLTRGLALKSGIVLVLRYTFSLF